MPISDVLNFQNFQQHSNKKAKCERIFQPKFGFIRYG